MISAPCRNLAVIISFPDFYSSRCGQVQTIEMVELEELLSSTVPMTALRKVFRFSIHALGEMSLGKSLRPPTGAIARIAGYIKVRLVC